MAGAILYYSALLVDISGLLGISYSSRLSLGLIIIAFVNLGSVIFEVSELFIDKAKGKKYLVGPGVHDTNYDLLMLLLGSVLAMVVWLLAK